MKLNDRIKAAVELQEQLKDFVTLGRTQSRLTQKNNNDMIVALNQTKKMIKLCDKINKKFEFKKGDNL